MTRRIGVEPLVGGGVGICVWNSYDDGRPTRTIVHIGLTDAEARELAREIVEACEEVTE